PKEFAAYVARRAREFARASDRPADAKGVALTPLVRTIDDAGYHYAFVDARIDRDARQATLTVKAPADAQPHDVAAIERLGAAWWPLQMARELDDAILMLRTNELDIGTWILKTTGDIDHVLAVDASLSKHAGHWFVRETIALLDKGSCFAGTLLELALAADRSYVLDLPDQADAAPRIAVSSMNFSAYPRVDGLSRIES